MGKIFGANTKISGKVGQLLYRQTRTGTIISELPVKPAIPRRSARQMDRRTQWGNLAAIYKQFDSMLRRGYENLPPQMSVFNAFIQANIDVVKVYITKTIRLNGGAILAPYQITRGSLPSISMAKNTSNILVSGIRLGTLAIDANTTIGQFSQAVIDNNDAFDEGDQLTFFHGIQSIDTVTRTPRATIRGYKVVLSTAEDTKLWDVVDRIGFSVTDNCLATSSPTAPPSGCIAARLPTVPSRSAPSSSLSRTLPLPPIRDARPSPSLPTAMAASTPPLSISSPKSSASTPSRPDCPPSADCSTEAVPSSSVVTG